MFRRASLLGALLVGCIQLVGQGLITTLAGTTWVFPGDGRPASSAPLGRIERMVFDRNGNLFVADPENNMVFRIDTNGVLKVVAGNGRSGFGGDNGPATSAQLSAPTGVRVGPDGALYIADSANNRIRKVSASGVISTLAGTGNYGFNGDGIPATFATLRAPIDVAIDSSGNIYFTDYVHIRKITIATGMISTIAGLEDAGFSGDGGKAVAAALSFPLGLFIDAKDQIFIADNGNYRVRKIGTDGVIQTIAGNGDSAPVEEGIATTVSIRDVAAVAVDAGGVVYVTDTSHARVVKITPDGKLTNVAGNGSAVGFSGDGGPGPKALLNTPEGVAVDSLGNVYVADTFNLRIRRVKPDGIISAFAGNGNFKFGGDGGPTSAALLNEPSDVVFDQKGNIYISDTRNQRIRKIDTSGVITTLAGIGIGGFSGDGGKATAATLDTPVGLAVDAAGNLYVGDTANRRVRKIDANGIISTFAAGTAELGTVSHLAFDHAGNLYVSIDFRVLKITSSGTISTFAGTGNGDGDLGDGGPATKAGLGYIGALAFDSKDNLYIAELYRGRVRRVSAADGIIRTYAGNGTSCCGGDGGPAVQAGIDALSLAFDSSDTLYIGSGDRIRKVGTNGIISLVAGTGFPEQGVGDGGSALLASLDDVTGLRTDSAGNLYAVDSGHGRVRAILNVPPRFDVTPQTLSFDAKSGGAPPVDQFLRVTSAVTNLVYKVTAVNSEGNWLNLQPLTGVTPGVIQITANPSALAPGSYEGTVTLEAPQSNPSLRVVNVRFNVAPASAPTLAAEPGDLGFDFVSGFPGDSQALFVRNNGPGTIRFNAVASTTNGGDWLKIDQSSGTATATEPVRIEVFADPGKLPPGTYSGLISVTSDSMRAFVPVIMTLHSTAQTIVLTEDGLTFESAAGSAVQKDTIEIFNTGLGNLNWSATARVLSGNTNWLTVKPETGASGPARSTASQIEVSADPSQLPAGDYYGQILITAPEATNSPQTLSVVFHVGDANGAADPDVRPTGSIFVGFPGAAPASQDFIVSNLGGQSTSFRSTASSDSGPVFFTYQPTEATVDAAQPVRLTIQPLPGSLQPGIKRGRVTLEFTDGTIRVIEVVLVVPATTGSALPGARGATGCTPTKLAVVFSLLGQQFQVFAAWPQPIETRITDDCGTPLTDGSVVVSFSNGDPSIPLQDIGGGRWGGTWQPRISAPQVSATANAQNAAGTLRGATQAAGGVDPNPLVPVIVPGSVLNAASLRARTPVTPGGMISIFGSNLSSEPRLSEVPRSTLLNGTLVVMGGVTLPLLYVSPTQINALVPSKIPANTNQQLYVLNRNSSTLPIPVAVAPAQPAVFSVDGSGTGQGHIYSGTGVLADAGNPVKAGDAVVIYCAGLGKVDQEVQDGFPVPDAPLARVIDPVTVTIGGKPANVLFAGLTPRFTGLYQINVVIPDGLGSNGAAEVILKVSDQTSPVVTMGVR